VRKQGANFSGACPMEPWITGIAHPEQIQVIINPIAGEVCPWSFSYHTVVGSSSVVTVVWVFVPNSIPRGVKILRSDRFSMVSFGHPRTPYYNIFTRELSNA